MKEIWKDIEGYEGLYQVSNLGNVKTLNYKGKHKVKILKHQIDKDGYHKVSLYDIDKKPKRFSVHKLVCLAFLENPHNYPIINHIDEDKDNNALSNLEWCSYGYNVNFGTRNSRVSAKMIGNSNSKNKQRNVTGNY